MTTTILYIIGTILTLLLIVMAIGLLISGFCILVLYQKASNLELAIKGIEEAFNWKLLGPNPQANIYEWKHKDNMVWLLPVKELNKK